MSKLFNSQIRVATLAAMLGVVGLAGCGGIEFESKLLDNVGLSPKALLGDGKHSNKKLETRSAIVVPPSTDVLPVPGQAQAATAIATAPLDPSFPVNPEAVEAERKRVAAAKTKEECDPNNGAFGSRQSGEHAIIDGSVTAEKAECSTPIRDAITQ